jgi:hypothetical protein
VPPQIDLMQTEVDAWFPRAEEFVDIVAEIFPDTFLLWRWLHYCKVTRLKVNVNHTEGRLGAYFT